MPGPLDLGGDDYRAHVKAQAVLRNRRYRERLRERRSALREQPRLDGEAAHATPPHTPPVLSPLSTREIEKTMMELAGRGYAHTERFWQLASQQYPLLNLELEAIKAADWLLEPRNSKRRCSKAFLDNWLKKAEADRVGRERAAARVVTMSEQGPSRYPDFVGDHRPVDPPIAYQKNPGPDPAPWLTAELTRFSPEEEARMREQQARVPYQERLAKLAAAGRNGVHTP